MTKPLGGLEEQGIKVWGAGSWHLSSREGAKQGKAPIFIVSCQSRLLPGIKLPGKEMKVLAGWQEAQEIASSIQLELDSIKFKKKIQSKPEHH